MNPSEAVGKWQPLYFTVRKQQEQWLCDGIDWSYFDGRIPLDDREKKQMEWLRGMETAPGEPFLATNYGGWPRIWHRVLRVGMGVHWPTWRPTPVIIVDGTLGHEWFDWNALTDCKALKGE